MSTGEQGLEPQLPRVGFEGPALSSLGDEDQRPGCSCQSQSQSIMMIVLLFLLRLDHGYYYYYYCY